MDADEYRRRAALVQKMKGELRQAHAEMSVRRNDLALAVMATDRAVRAYRRAVANVERSDTERQTEVTACAATVRRLRMTESTMRANLARGEHTLRRAEDAVRTADVQFQIDSADAEGERPREPEPPDEAAHL